MKKIHYLFYFHRFSVSQGCYIRVGLQPLFSGVQLAGNGVSKYKQVFLGPGDWPRIHTIVTCSGMELWLKPQCTK